MLLQACAATWLVPNAANEPRANGIAVCESGDRREETSFEKVDTR